MMRGLITKTLREMRLVYILAAIGLCVLTGLLTRILPQLQEGLSDFILQVPFIRTIISGMMGIDISQGLTPNMFLAVVWTHPVLLSVVWGYDLVFCTRMPAGEVDRGTIDILLGWPVSRRTVYLSESIVWVVTGAIILAMGLLGYFISSTVLPMEQQPDFKLVALCALNLYCTYIAVGGVTFLISTMSDRRGRALGAAFAILLASFLINFLAQFWEPASYVKWLSVAYYYQPATVLLNERIPFADIAVLVVFGFVAWGAGLVIMRSRSLCTV